MKHAYFQFYTCSRFLITAFCLTVILQPTTITAAAELPLSAKQLSSEQSKEELEKLRGQRRTLNAQLMQQIDLLPERINGLKSFIDMLENPSPDLNDQSSELDFYRQWECIEPFFQQLKPLHQQLVEQQETRTQLRQNTSTQLDVMANILRRGQPSEVHPEQQQEQQESEADREFQEHMKKTHTAPQQSPRAQLQPNLESRPAQRRLPHLARPVPAAAMPPIMQSEAANLAPKILGGAVLLGGALLLGRHYAESHQQMP